MIPARPVMKAHIQDSVRNILQKMDCKIQELPNSREKTECCSYGGLMWLANRPVAEEVVQRRIAESELDYVTYCACAATSLQNVASEPCTCSTWSYGAPEVDWATAPAMGFSQRHENRIA